jgi:hypothetical protein
MTKNDMIGRNAPVTSVKSPMLVSSASGLGTPAETGRAAWSVGGEVCEASRVMVMATTLGAISSRERRPKTGARGESLRVTVR